MVEIKDRKDSNIEKTVDEIIRFMPKNEEFKAMDIVDKVFLIQNGWDHDVYIKLVETLLKTIHGVQELENGRFYAHKEHFT